MVYLLIILGLAVLISLFWPKGGLIARWQHLRETSKRVQVEDALKHIYKSLRDGRRPTIESVSGCLQIKLNRATTILAEMEEFHLITWSEGQLKLTPAGHEYAIQIIRAHRLWERYLADRTGHYEGNWHRQAEQQEHMLTLEEIEALSESLGHPSHDPHGDPIPVASQEVPPHRGVPLATVPVGTEVRIEHVEDEPESIFTRLIQLGLYPGVSVVVAEKTSHQVRFIKEGEEYVLTPMEANNVAVMPIESDGDEHDSVERLSEFRTGEKARIRRISPSCRGLERRRLMDLGLVPGTLIEVEMASPLGDPVAYRVRGTIIALRQEQSRFIQVSRIEEEVAA